MYRISLKRNRPQAFLGALVGAVGGLASSLIGEAEQKRAAERQQYLQNTQNNIDTNNQLANQNANNAAQTLNNFVSQQQPQQNANDLNKSLLNGAGYAKFGTRRSLKGNGYKTIEAENGEVLQTSKPFKVTDGGVAIPIGRDTFLLRGAEHTDVNESGNTGIGLKLKQGKIDSNSIVLNDGLTPAQKIILGDNPNRVFKQQESLKRNITPPVGSYRHKAKYGDLVGTYGVDDLQGLGLTANGIDYIRPNTRANITTPTTADIVRANSNSKISLKGNNAGRNYFLPAKVDYWNLATDLIGSLNGTWFNRNLYGNLAKKVDYTSGLPSYQSAMPVVNMDTNWHADARFAENTRNNINAKQDIGRNTASASSALSRMQRSDTDYQTERNKIWDEKINKEAELRNDKAKLEASMAMQDAQSRNEWNKTIAAAKIQEQQDKLALLEADANRKSLSLQGIGDAFSNFFTQGKQRASDERAIAASLAAGPTGTMEQAYSLGLTNDNYTRNVANSVKRQYENYKGSRNSEAYKQLEQRYNLWKSAGLFRNGGRISLKHCR